MRTRFLAAVTWDTSSRAQIAGRMADVESFKLVYEQGPLLLFANGVVFPLDRHGVVLGRVHSKNAADFRVHEHAQSEVVSSGGSSLINTAWGGYVACIVSSDSERVRILRAPLGDLPCYWHRSPGLTLLGSDLWVMMAAGMARPSIDTSSLARHIMAEDLRRSETCLQGIRELRGGDRLAIGVRTSTCDTLWSPWQFTDRGRESPDARTAAANIHGAVLDSVSSTASRFRSIVLKLSGGLDSSIVAACLAKQNVPFACLNLATMHPAGDERQHARTVASHVQAPLMELFRRTRDVDVSHSAAARLPRPSVRAFTQASAKMAAYAADQSGAEAVFDGGGGDNVFCALQSARPAADCLLSSPGRHFYWSTARSIARLAEVSLATVISRSVAICARRSAVYRFPLDTRFIARSAMAAPARAKLHPWLDARPNTLPGKIAHVALIAAAQSVAEGVDVQEELPAYSPLIAQPVVEACLAVPTWLWFGDGLNRYAARRAFAGDLPVATVTRRSKGGPDCFLADLYEENRAQISCLLLGGVLDGIGLLDRPSIEAFLADQAPLTGHDFLRIMHLVDVEAWARNWT